MVKAPTKKSIREALAPMSRELLAGKYPRPIDLMGLKITCERLYNARGCPGYAWNVSFSALDPKINAPIGRIVHGGNLSTIVDQLYRRVSRELESTQ